jgi:hypothetical protein
VTGDGAGRALEVIERGLIVDAERQLDEAEVLMGGAEVGRGAQRAPEVRAGLIGGLGGALLAVPQRPAEPGLGLGVVGAQPERGLELVGRGAGVAALEQIDPGHPQAIALDPAVGEVAAGQLAIVGGAAVVGEQHVARQLVGDVDVVEQRAVAAEREPRVVVAPEHALALGQRRRDLEIARVRIDQQHRVVVEVAQPMGLGGQRGARAAGGVVVEQVVIERVVDEIERVAAGRQRRHRRQPAEQLGVQRRALAGVTAAQRQRRTDPRDGRDDRVGQDQRVDHRRRQALLEQALGGHALGQSLGHARAVGGAEQRHQALAARGQLEEQIGDQLARRRAPRSRCRAGRSARSRGSTAPARRAPAAGPRSATRRWSSAAATAAGSASAPRAVRAALGGEQAGLDQRVADAAMPRAWRRHRGLVLRRGDHAAGDQEVAERLVAAAGRDQLALVQLDGLDHAVAAHQEAPGDAGLVQIEQHRRQRPQLEIAGVAHAVGASPGRDSRSCLGHVARHLGAAEQARRWDEGLALARLVGHRAPRMERAARRRRQRARHVAGQHDPLAGRGRCGIGDRHRRQERAGVRVARLIGTARRRWPARRRARGTSPRRDRTGAARSSDRG